MKILVLLLFVHGLESSPRLDPLVETPQGLIKGLQADDGDYAMFLGVPYGVIDDNNPFGDATLHPGFNTTFHATKDPVYCPRYENGNSIGDIHCLNLNIYVPNSASTKNKLPVLFFIHGGAFIRGNANRQTLGPQYLVAHDVIVVLFNYRLGPYGFLCVDEPGYNNQGLKDQLLALKWVRNNIESFGGDVDNIVGAGQSAGAMSIDVLLLENEGLFKRVILQSGSALNPWVLTEVNNTGPIVLAKELGYETVEVKDALNFLSKADPNLVIKLAYDLQVTVFDGHPRTTPCIDGDMIKDFPVNLKPKVKNIDILIGHAFREVSFLYPDSLKSYYENYKFEEELARDFNSLDDVNDIKHFYIGDEAPNFDLRETILDYGSDFVFVHSTERSIVRYIEEKARNVFWYVFSYVGERNRNRVRHNLTSTGATHGDDLGYLFGLDTFTEDPNEDDQSIIDAMTKMWTDFVKYGNPTPSEPSPLIPVNWQPIKGQARPYLNIDKPITLENRPFNKRMSFWDVYYKLHNNQIKGKR
ncbi:bile salt-activated lipase-like isoform X2 [Anticarsia gemmatalis]